LLASPGDEAAAAGFVRVIYCKPIIVHGARPAKPVSHVNCLSYRRLPLRKLGCLYVAALRAILLAVK